MRNKEFEAWITSNGMPLPEVCVELKDRTAHCFVPCEVGKTFEVRWRDHGSKKFTAGYIYVDGFACPGRYLQGSGDTFRAGARSGPVSERPFVFAPINQEVLGLTGPAPNMNVGSVILKITEVERGPGRPSNRLEHLPVQVASSIDGMKTGGACVVFGDPPIHGYEQSPFTWSSKPANPNWNHSYVKFEFKYRTREWLQQQGMYPLDAPQQVYGMRPASEAMKLPMVPCAAPPPPAPVAPPQMGATEGAFAIRPENFTPHMQTQPMVLPTTRVRDVASGRPARVPSNRYPRELDGTVTMVRNVSGSSAGGRDDKGKGKAPAPAPTPRMPDAGDLATLAPPSSRPPIFAPVGSNLFILPPSRAGQQQRRVASGSSSTSMPPSNLPPMTIVLPKPQGHSSRRFDFSLGPGIGAPSGAMAANARRPLGSRNVSNSSVNSVDSIGSMGSMTSVPSVASGQQDWMEDFVDFDQMDQS